MATSRCKVAVGAAARIAALGLGLTTTLTGCVPEVHFGKTDSSVSGAAVTATIDRTLGANIHSNYPDLTVGSSVCPDHVDISDEKTATCRLTVDGIDIPIKVTADDARIGFFSVDFYGSFFSMRSIERATERNWQINYGRHPHIDCGAPRVRVYLIGKHFRCAVASMPKVTFAEFKSLADDAYVAYPPPGYHAKFRSWLQRALAAHKRGLPVRIIGTDLASYVDAGLQTDLAATPADVPNFGHMTCPTMVDLSASRSSLCLVPIAGKKVAYRISITPSQELSWKRVDAILDLTSIAKVAAQDINRRLVDAGSVGDAIVGCGNGYRVVRPPTSLYCDARFSGKTTRLEFPINDVDGPSGFREAP